MRYYTVKIQDEEFQLRLTTAKLEEYLKNTGGDENNPLIGVLDAMTLLPKRIKLLTAALQWPGNQNTVKHGAELLDKLLDDGVKPRAISNIILELAAMAGLMDEDELEDMMKANQLGTEKFTKAIMDMMAGREPEKAAPAEGDTQENGDSPTPTQAPDF